MCYVHNLKITSYFDITLYITRSVYNLNKICLKPNKQKTKNGPVVLYDFFFTHKTWFFFFYFHSLVLCTCEIKKNPVSLVK